MKRSPQTIITSIKFYLANNRKNDAVEEMEEYIDDVCFSAQLDHARELLTELPKTDLPLDIFISALQATFAWKHMLKKEREALYLLTAKTAFEVGGKELVKQKLLWLQ